MSTNEPMPDIANLSLEEKRNLIARLLREKAGQPRTAPLSFAQQRLWFLEQLDPGSPLYNIPRAMRLRGPLDSSALEHSFNEIARRHESLRTVFETRDSNQLQVINEPRPLSLPFLDLSHLATDEREAEARRLMIAEVQHGFDLARGPLIRTSLLRLEPELHVLLFTMHHIISDGWSMGILISELFTLYEAHSTNGDSPLAELTIQYADYAEWQRERLQGPLLESQLSYWKQQLAGAPRLLELPTDRPRPATQSHRGAHHPFALSAELSKQLTAFSQQEGVTLFMTLLAAFQTLLSRYSGQKDIMVGTPVAGRNHTQVERLIGLFLNTLVLRADLSGNPSFRELVRRVKDVCLEAYAHQDLPFEKLVEELQLERDLSYAPLFQVMLMLQNAPREELSVGRLQLSTMETESGTAKFDLTLVILESEQGLRGAWEYNSDIFDPTTIERWSGHFETLLTEIVAAPDRRLAELPLLSQAERRQLLSEWNDTQGDYLASQCLHELFERQVLHTPDALALSFETEHVSYDELNRRANRIGHQLRARGVGPEARVGLMVERSIEMVVGLLGILKAGAAYVPLDPAYPQERLAFMIKDAAVDVLVTHSSLAKVLPASEAPVVCVDADEPGAGNWSELNCVSGVRPSNLAYVIYTSGSSGQPKGVMINHANVANFCAAMDARLGVAPAGQQTQNTLLAVTSIAFDISVLELFWTLTKGFSVVIQSLQLEARHSSVPRTDLAVRPIAFSLFYFAADETETNTVKYRLLMEGAKFADQHGFSAVWTPERHFHAFGGLYPNPSVTSAAIAAVTERVQIRAGSVVLPLHHPLRVAEEWSVVDNISNGRVGISFASGWHANDFVLAPLHYAERKQVMMDHIDTVRRLWRGESLSLPDGNGDHVQVKILPRPVQRELPVWLTAAGNPDTFRLAGEIGANLLTHLLGQSVEELSEKLEVYRTAWRASGHAGDGYVTLMLHTFVGPDLDEVRETVRKPFSNYLKTSVDLTRSMSRSVAAQLSEADIEALAEQAFDRYFETSGLMGTPADSLQTVNRLKSIGVDEIGCLIDFGVDQESVMSSLQYLEQVMKDSNKGAHAEETGIRSEQPSPAIHSYSIAEQLERQRVTHLQCTPSMARMFTLEPETLRALGSLETLLLGGEELPSPLAAQLRQVVAGEIHNMYGPTETTIWSATYQVTEQDEGQPVSIGRPILNTQVYILDESLQPTPLGVAGELLIGGHGVSRGYFKRPALTAEKFIPDSFSTLPGARLYCTGDRARFRQDGRIEFLGRMDQQVKLRGFRIELGEIEAVLRRQEGVSECVVAAREDLPGEKYLVAYLVPQDKASLSPDKLRRGLREHLPEYMLPTAWMILDALPMTPNGKVHRQALPAPEQQLRPETGESFIAPRTPTEEGLAGIWRQAFKLEHVGVNDNFFVLGGHSLLAVDVISHAREMFQVEVPLRNLFETPTIAGLAEGIEAAILAGHRVEMIAIKPIPRDQDIPLSFDQEGRIIREHWESSQGVTSRPFLTPAAYHLSGPLEVDLLEQALDDVIRRHEILRTTFPFTSWPPVQFIAPQMKVPIAVADVSAVAEDQRWAEIERMIVEERQKPFDYASGPLLRISLLRSGPLEHVLSVTMSHYIADGASLQIFMRELIALYIARTQQVPAQLAELPIQFADFAYWQRQWLQGETLDGMISYWRERISNVGIVPELELPFAHQRPELPSYRGATESLDVPSALTKSLKTLCYRYGVTQFMLLLAALKALLHRYTGKEELGVVIPSANRSLRETQPLIGWFNNIHVISSKLSDEMPFSELLKQIRETMLGGYAHQHIPYTVLFGALLPQNQSGDVFQNFFRVPYVFFDLIAQPGDSFETKIPDVKISPREIGESEAETGIALRVVEKGDEMRLFIIYEVDAYDAADIRQMLEDYVTLLSGIVANAEVKIKDFPLKTQETPPAIAPA